jgi:F-type H+-transporting ATPase subunit b
VLENFFFIIAQAHEALPDAAEHAEPGFFMTLIHTNIINIIIAFGFIAWLVKRYNLFSGIETTQNKIIANIQESIKVKETSIDQLKEAERSLESAHEEAQSIILQAEKSALHIKEEIIQEAREDAEKIVEHARKIAENERTRITTELETNLTIAAVEVAREHIKKSLDEGWQKQLINDFVENMSNLRINNK